jgi:ATP synthase protein I
MVVFVAAFKNTTLFNPRAFAIVLVVSTLTWIAAQTRAHMKAKILYVDPDASSKGDKPEKTGRSS